MQELIRIFDELESKGWVCLLKWDGQRKSKPKTVVVQHSAENKLFRGDFNSLDQALASLQAWLLNQEVNEGPAALPESHRQAGAADLAR